MNILDTQEVYTSISLWFQITQGLKLARVYSWYGFITKISRLEIQLGMFHEPHLFLQLEMLEVYFCDGSLDNDYW